MGKFNDLDLRSPDEVPLPSPTSDPIPELPLYDGRHCLKCAYLCLSEKRMSQHWSEDHGQTEVHDRPAKIQTFFKGNKLRYFEVACAASNAAEVDTPVSVAGSTTYSPTSTLVSSAAIPTPMSLQVDSCQYSSRQGSTYNVQALKLMHHFTHSTSTTMNGGSEDENWWKFQIAEEAFKHEYLLHGLLALSAIHLATKSSGLANVRHYINLSSYYQSLALPLFRKALESPSSGNGTALIAHSRVTGVVRCAEKRLRWQRQIDPLYQPATSELVELLMLLRGTCITHLDFHSYLPIDSAWQLNPETYQQCQELRAAPMEAEMADFDHAYRSVVTALAATSVTRDPSDDLRNLGTLRASVTQLVIAEPLQTQRVLFAALKIICQSYEGCFRSSSLWQTWKNMELLPLTASSKFIDLLSDGHPAALVIFAHWAVILEHLRPRYWFIEGEANHVVDVVRSMVSEEVTRLLPVLSQENG